MIAAWRGLAADASQHAIRAADRIRLTSSSAKIFYASGLLWPVYVEGLTAGWAQKRLQLAVDAERYPAVLVWTLDTTPRGSSLKGRTPGDGTDSNP